MTRWKRGDEGAKDGKKEMKREDNRIKKVMKGRGRERDEERAYQGEIKIVRGRGRGFFIEVRRE